MSFEDNPAFDEDTHGEFIGSFFMHGGVLVFHIFEIVPTDGV